MIYRSCRVAFLAALPLSVALGRGSALAQTATALQPDSPTSPPTTSPPTTSAPPKSAPPATRQTVPPFALDDALPPAQFGSVNVDESRAGQLRYLISTGKVERRIKDIAGFLTFREGARGFYDVKFEALGDRDNGKVRVMVTIVGQSGGRTILARGQNVQEWRDATLIYLDPPTGVYPFAGAFGTAPSAATGNAPSVAGAPSGEPLFDASPDATTGAAPAPAPVAEGIAYFAPVARGAAPLFCGDDKGERNGRFKTATTGGGRAGVSKGSNDKKNDKDDDKEQDKPKDKPARAEKPTSRAPNPQPGKSASKSDDAPTRSDSKRPSGRDSSSKNGSTPRPRYVPPVATVYSPVSSDSPSPRTSAPDPNPPGQRGSAPDPNPPNSGARRIPSRPRRPDWDGTYGRYPYPNSYPYPYPVPYPYPSARRDRDDGARQAINYALALARAQAEADFARQLSDDVPPPNDEF